MESTMSLRAEALTGRRAEMRRLLAAFRERKSLLICGPRGSGKTFLVEQALARLSDSERRTCIRWSGPANNRALLTHFVGGLVSLDDPVACAKIDADGAARDSLRAWFHKQTSLRLRGILFIALKSGHYRIFLDHFPAASRSVARLMKEIVQRCRTPVYWNGFGHSAGDIGYLWSLYWHDALRLRLGPLNLPDAKHLLETSIERSGLKGLDLADFREEVLARSGLLPGAIVRLCELAAHSRYRCGNQIKMKLLHVDYLMASRGSTAHMHFER